jgi:lipopolysaccharide transport system permease protein
MNEFNTRADKEMQMVTDLLPKTATLGSLRLRMTIEAKDGWSAFDFREIWAYRDLLWVLIEREIKLRYKQTALGVIWVILQPLIAALIFAVILGRFANLPSDKFPYLVFVFSGLVAWTYFTSAVQRGSNSLIANSQLITKVYFPRLLIPLANTMAAFVDLLVMLAIMVILMFAYRIRPGLQLLTLPMFLFLLILTATGVTLWLAALSVRYRDFAYALPFLLQVWMYASPIIYPASVVPERWKLVYGLNPAVGLIEGFRWSLLGRGTITMQTLFLTGVISLSVAISGALFFRRVERSFADVI